MARRTYFVLVALTIATLASAAPEYNIKAGYLLLFTRYVQWPDAAFAGPRDPIVVCVAGPDPFGTVLEDTMQGQESQSRPLVVRHVAHVEAARGCHVLFVGSAPEPDQRAWLSEFATRPVLTISDQPDAFDLGAMLWFVKENQGDATRVRFEASLPAMQRAGLKASSQMLVAAKRVVRGDAAADSKMRRL